MAIMKLCADANKKPVAKIGVALTRAVCQQPLPRRAVAATLDQLWCPSDVLGAQPKEPVHQHQHGCGDNTTPPAIHNKGMLFYIGRSRIFKADFGQDAPEEETAFTSPRVRHSLHGSMCLL
jgi:hypothetical protein